MDFLFNSEKSLLEIQKIVGLNRDKLKGLAVISVIPFLHILPSIYTCETSDLLPEISEEEVFQAISGLEGAGLCRKFASDELGDRSGGHPYEYINPTVRLLLLDLLSNEELCNVIDTLQAYLLAQIKSQDTPVLPSATLTTLGLLEYITSVRTTIKQYGDKCPGNSGVVSDVNQRYRDIKESGNDLTMVPVTNRLVTLMSVDIDW